MSKRAARFAQLDLVDVPAGAGVPTLISRGVRRSARSAERPVPMPWQCTVLAVDTAKVSGWAIFCQGKLHAFDEVDTEDETALFEIVRRAVTTVALGLPCVLVLEAPWGGSVDVIAALGAARERWLRAWRQHEQSAGRVVKVKPSTWRAAVLGGRSIGMSRDQVRALELRTALALIGVRGEVLGHDAAAAILIGRWACHSWRVGRCIGKRAVRASLRGAS